MLRMLLCVGIFKILILLIHTCRIRSNQHVKACETNDINCLTQMNWKKPLKVKDKSLNSRGKLFISKNFFKCLATLFSAP